MITILQYIVFMCVWSQRRGNVSRAALVQFYYWLLFFSPSCFGRGDIDGCSIREYVGSSNLLEWRRVVACADHCIRP